MPTLARFEYEVFSRAAQGQPLTAVELKHIMQGFFAEGYGETMRDDPARTGITWAQFLHLYEPFYTFQYAIEIGAADALAAKILAGEEGWPSGTSSSSVRADRCIRWICSRWPVWICRHPRRWRPGSGIGKVGGSIGGVGRVVEMGFAQDVADRIVILGKRESC